jgi:hypothetical protein
VTRLVGLGHTPSTICVFDEHWELVRRLAPLLEAVTGNASSGDIFTFHRSAAPDVANTSGFGSAPHRDKPHAGPESFRADGAAMYCTVWVALSDATPATSCLYVVPREADPSYAVAGDQLGAALEDYQSIRALPTDAGGACVFSHRLVHWGSRPSRPTREERAAGAPAVPPRVAMSYALADNAAFGLGAYFDHGRFSPFPPLPLRVALRAAQAILFSHQKPFPKGGLGYATRLCRRGSGLFLPRYQEKLNDACQWQKFQAGR